MWGLALMGLEAGRCIGAGDRVRTGDIDLGKVALYQLSYSRSEAYSTFCNDIVVKSIHLTATRPFRAVPGGKTLWRTPSLQKCQPL